MEITTSLKKRFCKDMNIPISLFQEPYFTDRLELLEKQYGAKTKYNMFKDVITKYETEEEYFKAYIEIKEKVMDYLKENKEMQYFINDLDMTNFSLEERLKKHKNKVCELSEEEVELYKFATTCKKAIYTQSNIGKQLLSIDMKKANYTALKMYDKEIVKGTDTYEEFMGTFTDEAYFINSKYIRQVIFGSINPSRQVKFEQWLMYNLLFKLLEFTPKKAIMTVVTDEIVIDLTEVEDKLSFLAKVQTLIVDEQQKGFNLRVESYNLEYLEGIDVYVKRYGDASYEIKCSSPLKLPFVIRELEGKEVQENDYVYYNTDVGVLCKLMQKPEITHIRETRV